MKIKNQSLSLFKKPNNKIANKANVAFFLTSRSFENRFLKIVTKESITAIKNNIIKYNPIKLKGLGKSRWMIIDAINEIKTLTEVVLQLLLCKISKLEFFLPINLYIFQINPFKLFQTAFVIKIAGIKDKLKPQKKSSNLSSLPNICSIPIKPAQSKDIEVTVQLSGTINSFTSIFFNLFNKFFMRLLY